MSTDAPAPPAYVPGGQPGPWRRSPVRRVLLWGAVVLLFAFWVWALFFAPKESVNKIEDRAWAERAEAICVRTDAELRALVRDLARTEMPYTSPRGKPTVILFSTRELNRKFGRD